MRRPNSHMWTRTKKFSYRLFYEKRGGCKIPSECTEDDGA